MKIKSLVMMMTVGISLLLASCGSASVTTYSITGTISGLSGTGLVLQNNSGNNLSVSANGSFVFTPAIASGSTYSVTVLTQPSGPAQNCVVAGGGGTASANVTNIQITCTTITETIGGTISGLTGTGLVLQDNGGDNLSVAAAATAFTFATQVASGSNYAVTVLDQPTGQTCTITNGSGTVINVAVTNITIACSENTSNISVVVSGMLPNTSVVLQDNAADNLTVSANGAANKFHTSIDNGSPYAVTVLTQPAGATCLVGPDGSGTLASAKMNIAVTCGNIIAAGESHTCAMTSAGAVLCWGLNEYGQLGNGNTTDSTTPVPVIGLSSGVVSIAAGYESTCALTSAGAVWCWGYNANGQLGNGTFAQSSIPVEVLNPAGNAPLSGVAIIASGQYHTCAVTNGGAALCWGDNAKSELGNGADLGSNIPVAVSGLSSGVATISAGSYFTCAVTTAGEALCWGEGSSGQLGNGNATNSTTPTEVLDPAGNAPLGGVVAISASFENACALTNEGTVQCWGANNAGQLGIAATSPQSNIPVEVLDSTGKSTLTGVVAIAAGQSHTCVVTAAGAALCWGDNAEGELGNSSSSDATSPIPVSGLSSNVAGIAAGYGHTCAVTGTGAAQCWGLNLDGQLDSGNTTTSSTPVDAVGLGDKGFLQLF